MVSVKIRLMHVRESDTVLDSGFHAVDTGLQYWIAVFVSGTWILDSSLSGTPGA